jgi:hypothetical protein
MNARRRRTAWRKININICVYGIRRNEVDFIADFVGGWGALWSVLPKKTKQSKLLKPLKILRYTFIDTLTTHANISLFKCRAHGYLLPSVV